MLRAGFRFAVLNTSLSEAVVHELIGAAVRYFVPSDIAGGDPDTARQGRMVVYMALIEALAATAYGLTYVAVGMPISAASTMGVALVAGATLFAFRRTGSIRACGHLLGLVPFVALIGIGGATGALSSPALGWFMLCPIIPAMVVGRRAGIPWAAASVAFFAALLGAEFAGVGIPSEVPGWYLPLLLTVVPAGLVLVAFLIAWTYEAAKDEALERVREAGAALAVARDEAKQAHAAARLVLDSVSEGLVLVHADGSLADEHSAALGAWFGPQPADRKIWEMFAAQAPRFSEWLELGWEDLTEGFMPIEVVAAQLPSSLQVDGRHLSVRYQPLLGEDEALEHVLVIISDVTAQLEAERAEQVQQELMAVFLKLVQDRGAVIDFLDEARRLVEAVGDGRGSPAQEKRWVHTLKGNAALFGLGSIASWLHALEDRLSEQPGCTIADREALRQRWGEVEERLAPVLAVQDRSVMTVERSAFLDLLQRASEGAEGEALAEALRQWEWEPVRARLERLAERGEGLAERLGKPGVRLQVEAEDIRQPADPAWSAFWGAMVHVVRNAVDHGIEDAEGRAAAGKDRAGEVSLRARREGEHLIVEVADDGAGIDWARIVEKAGACGLPVESHEDRVLALFSDGLTTRDEVTETSGRGVGTSAVWEACQAIGGEIDVVSVPGQGSRFRFRLPCPTAARQAA